MRRLRDNAKLRSSVPLYRLRRRPDAFAGWGRRSDGHDAAASAARLPVDRLRLSRRRQALRRRSGSGGLMLEQFHFENQRRIRPDVVAGAALAVGEIAGIKS